MASVSRQERSSHTPLEVSARPKIMALLERLGQPDQRLGISPLGTVKLYPAAITAIDAGREQLRFSPLDNPQAHAKILRSGQLRACAYLEGVRIQFITRLVRETGNAGETGDGGDYCARIPPYLLYYQQRVDTRIPLSEQRIELTGISPDGLFLAGQVNDISESGLGLLLMEGGPFSAGDHLNEVRLKLPGSNEVFRCNLEVRSQKTNAEGQNTLGTRFVDLDPEHRQRVRQSLAALQREQMLEASAATPAASTRS